MDFLDKTFASPNQAVFAGFLGIDLKSLNLFPKAKKPNLNLAGRFPYSSDCATHAEMVGNLRMELDRVWNLYLGSTASEKQMYLNQATEIKNYLDKAVEYMNTTACPGMAGLVVSETIIKDSDPDIKTKPAVRPVESSMPAQTGLGNQQLIAGVDNKIIMYAAMGIIFIAVVKMIR